MKSRLLLLLVPALLLAARPWDVDEIRRNSVTVPGQALPKLRPGTLSKTDYLPEIREVCDFAAAWQVSDSFSPNFGGLIEAEHLPSIVETDNTQEAIWIWTRWYELTGRNDYAVNIRRAWHYVMNFPAYREAGGQPWYAVWNCGLGFFAEMEYRHVYGDSSRLAYADTCRRYCYANPLNFAGNSLHVNVTSLAAGMMYAYALDRGDSALRDTALAYGNRVKAWVESHPSVLRTGNWAMSGGTVLWGVCKSIWQRDTTAGKTWLRTYADSVPYFVPSGTWNCSWNIWDANAFRAVGELTHDSSFFQYHQRLTDTLHGLDENGDDDGGIMATWTDPQNQDQVWVSTYLVFMGMNFLVPPPANFDAAVTAVLGIDSTRIHLTGDTLYPQAVVTNLGRERTGFPVELVFPGKRDTALADSLPYAGTDTVSFGPQVLTAPGPNLFRAISLLSGDERRANDTASAQTTVWTPRLITGHLRDSLSEDSFSGTISFYPLGDTRAFRTVAVGTSGDFSLAGIDTTFLVRLHSDIPYPNRQWSFRILGDTELTLHVPPAHLILVDNDTLSQWESFYTSTFDTLHLDYHLWQRRIQGPIPGSPLLETRSDVVVWYSGRSGHHTLDTSDMDTFSRFLDRGGRLMITGQNIGQELCSTDFYLNRLHARLVNPSISQLYLFGNPSDPLGSLFGTTQSAGTGGANNQNSRDQIAPDSLSHAFLFYDTTTHPVSGIYYADNTDSSRIIYLGFGFEAVNKPSNQPTFMSRVTFFNQCYAWLTGSSAILEPLSPDALPLTPFLSASPNPFHERVHFTVRQSGARNQESALKIHDATGRLVRALPIPRQPASGTQDLTWDGTDQFGRGVPAGLYFAVLAGQENLVSTRIVRFD